jgi:hypothetical protein
MAGDQEGADMSNSLIGRVRFVPQPTRKTCGQTCVAMITGETVEQVCHGLGNYGSTTTYEVCLALRAAGVAARVEDFRPIGEGSFAAFGVVSVRSDDGTRGHFALWVGDAYLCPSAGELEPAAAWELWTSDGMQPRDLLPLELP